MTKLHSIDVNNGTLTVLCDGHDPMPAELFNGPPQSEIRRIFKEAGFEDGAAINSVNAFLYQTPEHNMLIDAGGAGIIPTIGEMHDQLALTGVSPDEIDIVFCTHLHPDHIGGLMQHDKPVFANATLWVHQAELDFWGNQDIAAGAPDEVKPFFHAAQNVIAGYQDSLHPFSSQVECIPGVITMPLPGHTPGHTGLQIGTPETGIFVWADIVHIPVLQLALPTTSIAFDIDPVMAVSTRQKTLERVERENMRVAGGHLTGSGFGYIRKASNGYLFEPEQHS